MIDYTIIATGSQGNAVVVNDFLLIDCGVPFKSLLPYYKKLRLVLLTHIHFDHFKKATIKNLALQRPTLRFGCGRWLVPALIELGVSKSNIDILDYDTRYGYGLCNVIPVPLVHNVPNQGYKIHFWDGSKMIYATDTNNLNGITAYHYDLYLIEGNHDETEIRERIAEKESLGVFAYEKRVIRDHLSIQKCNNFIVANAGPNSRYEYLHKHKDKEDINNDTNCEDS